MSAITFQSQQELRLVAYRTCGGAKGSIVRLMSPSDLGKIIKPFVFLDLIDAESSFLGRMRMHPHSGIATVTVVTEGDLRFNDPTDGVGTIDYGAVEWMRASGGVWHGKEVSAGISSRIRGFQLWLALRPELENAEVDSQYIQAGDMPQCGFATVILGEHQGVRSPVRSPEGVNYLLVTIPAGERWEYQPPEAHTTLWLSISRGSLRSPYLLNQGELIIFEPSNKPIFLEAKDEDAVFVLGSAVPHPYDLKLGRYSVHTSDEALRAGEEKIKEIGSRLKFQHSAKQKAKSVPIFR